MNIWCSLYYCFCPLFPWNFYKLNPFLNPYFKILNHYFHYYHLSLSHQEFSPGLLQAPSACSLYTPTTHPEHTLHHRTHLSLVQRPLMVQGKNIKVFTLTYRALHNVVNSTDPYCCSLPYLNSWLPDLAQARYTPQGICKCSLALNEVAYPPLGFGHNVLGKMSHTAPIAHTQAPVPLCPPPSHTPGLSFLLSFYHSTFSQLISHVLYLFI
jgi:hypothetical protein